MSHINDITANEKPTACVLCSMNCGLKVSVYENKITEVKADSSNPISKGHICNKAFSINHYVDHALRLKEPLKRDNSKHTPITWEIALEEIATKLKYVENNFGGNTIAVAGLGGQANHSDGFFGIALLKYFNSSWFFSAYAQEKTQHHLVEKLMFDSPNHSMTHADLWNSDVCIIIGSNILVSNRGYKNAKNIRKYKASGKSIFVIDPRENETTKKSDIHINPKPGADVWLLAAMIAMILKNSWQDKNYIANNVQVNTTFLSLFRNLDIKDLCSRAGVVYEDVYEVTRAYAHADKASILWDTGIEWIPNTTLVSWLLKVMIVITGNFGKPGGNYLRPGFAADGDFLAAKEPFVAPASGIVGIPALTPFEMFSPNILIDEIEAGNIKALLVSNANPLRTYANTERLRKAFEKLELLVVIDVAYTETAMQADYVLAAPSGYEKWEWASFGRKFPYITAHLRKPICYREGNTKTEAEIFQTILQYSGAPTKAPRLLQHLVTWLGKDGWNNNWIGVTLLLTSVIAAKANPWQTFVRWVSWSYDVIGPYLPAKNISAMLLNCQLVAFTRYKQFIKTPTKNPFVLGKEWFKQVLHNHNGVILGELPWDWHFTTAIGYRDRKIRLAPKVLHEALINILTQTPKLDDDYPLILCAGERSQSTANTILRNPLWRKGKTAKCTLRIHPSTAHKYGLEKGDMALLETAIGQNKIEVNLDQGMHPDSVSMPNGIGLLYPNANSAETLESYGINPNNLTDHLSRDEFTAIPFHKYVACRISKAS